jgi:predicted Rossmann-fold nucleotide-binding protein
LAKHKIELVYGGANVGWGAVADGVLNGGGIVGVIPDFLRSKKSLTMD